MTLQEEGQRLAYHLLTRLTDTGGKTPADTLRLLEVSREQEVIDLVEWLAELGVGFVRIPLPGTPRKERVLWAFLSTVLMTLLIGAQPQVAKLIPPIDVDGGRDGG